MGANLRSFASDNNSGASPEILAALGAANSGHAVGYGDDEWTRRAEAAFAREFGPDSRTFFVYNGTGANVLALSLASRPGSAIFCSADAHVAVDEAGAPEAACLKPVPLPSHDGKLSVEALEETLHNLREIHAARPSAVTISQPTELGTLYSPEEVRRIADLAHGKGLALHVDGARIANAAAAFGTSFRAITADLGVDLLSFGGTKNGILFGEAVVVLTPRYAEDAPFLRKTRTQLASKMRYLSAQYEAYLADGLWRRNAEASNAAARRLASLVGNLPGVALAKPVETNAVFARLPAEAAEALRKAYFFYDWEGGLVRWMTSFDTTEADLQGFAATLKGALGM